MWASSNVRSSSDNGKRYVVRADEKADCVCETRICAEATRRDCEADPPMISS
jgi:hypothetical protein